MSHNPRGFKRQESTVDRFKRQVSRGASQFLGIEQESDSSNAWLQRRAAFHGSSLIMGHKISEKCKNKLEDGAEDAIPTPRDPLHVRGRPYVHDETDYRGGGRQLSQTSVLTRSSMGATRRRTHKKDSVARMAFDGISRTLGFKNISKPRSRLTSAQSKGLPPLSLEDLSIIDDMDSSRRQLAVAQTIPESDELDDDVFFDNKSHGTSAVDLRPVDSPAAPLAAGDIPRPMAPGWGRTVDPRPEIPDTPGVALDQVDFPFPTRMLEKVTQKVLEQPVEKRRLGEGLMGRIFQRSMIGEKEKSYGVREQLDKLHDHRPYFTYWVTVVQIIIYIVSVSVYGIAPIGFQKKIIERDVLVTALYPKRIGFEEPENFWIGPRQADLIHLGAKYAPCMRKDANIDELFDKVKKTESRTACCIYNDKSGCYQSSKIDCKERRATWKNGTVCNQDPKWCKRPRIQWPDDITKWPICQDRENRTLANEDHHMTCDVLSRPCCLGVKGECQIITEEHCKAKRGHFHHNATLCSQVKCMGKVCGMIKFLNEDHPDQFYRLWMSLFLHAGLFHLLLSAVFQFLVMRDTEKLTGSVRVAIIYLGAGVGGNLASAIFLPYHVEVGPAGSQFGILSTLWVEVIQSWQLIHSPGRALGKLSGFTLVLFILGLLPWIDNYAHLFGFIFGLLLSFAILPYITFGQIDKRRKLIGVIISFIVVIALYIILFIVFYIAPVRACEGCRYLNCIPFTSDFCENMGVSIGKSETIFEWDNAEL